MKISHRHFQIGWRHFWRQIAKVIRNPVLFMLTILGNSLLFVCACFFYLAERGVNPAIDSFGDAIWWAFVTITTVGYGDVIPVTVLGRFIAVLLMLTGGVLFLSFISLLSSAFVELEFLELERQIRELNQKLKTILENQNKPQ